MFMSRNSCRFFTLVFGAWVGLVTIVALTIPATAQTPKQIQQENNHENQNRLRAAEMERKAAEMRGVRSDLNPQIPPTRDKGDALAFSLSESGRSSLRSRLTIDDKVRALHLHGTPEELEEFETELTGMAQTNQAVYERFIKVQEIHLWMSCRNQSELDGAVKVLSRSKRLTDINIDCRNINTDSHALDLFGLATLERLRSIGLTVFSLARTSLDLPNNLESLHVMELGLSADPLLHIQLPDRLRKLSVVSDNSATRDRFTALTHGSGVTCQFQNCFSYHPGVRWYGSWVKTSGDGTPSQCIEIGATSYYFVRRNGGTALVPGYQIGPLGMLQQTDDHRICKLHLEDKEERASEKFRDQKVTVFKGSALLSLTFTADGGLAITLRPSDTPSGLNTGGSMSQDGPVIYQPDDGSFRKAVAAALVGTWRRPDIGSPPRKPVKREGSGQLLSFHERQAGSIPATGNQMALFGQAGLNLDTDSPFGFRLLLSWSILILGLLLFLSGGVILWKRNVGSRRAGEIIVAVTAAFAGVAIGGLVSDRLMYKMIGLGVFTSVILGLAAVIGLFKLPAEIRRRPQELLGPTLSCLVGFVLLSAYYFLHRLWD